MEQIRETVVLDGEVFFIEGLLLIPAEFTTVEDLISMDILQTERTIAV